MALINGCINKETGFKEKAVFEFSFFIGQLRETIIDAVGIGLIFEDGLSKIWSVIAGMILWYVRWMIKMAIFIYGVLFVTAWLCPHSGAKFW